MRFRKAPVAMVEMDMTPMIDVVFQLITFFMLITNFEQTQADERVKLPISERWKDGLHFEVDLKDGDLSVQPSPTPILTGDEEFVA